MNKAPEIRSLITELKERYREKNLIYRDHWEVDLCAIGFTTENSDYLVYISTWKQEFERYYVSVEPDHDTEPQPHILTLESVNKERIFEIINQYL